MFLSFEIKKPTKSHPHVQWIQLCLGYSNVICIWNLSCFVCQPMPNILFIKHNHFIALKSLCVMLLSKNNARYKSSNVAASFPHPHFIRKHFNCVCVLLPNLIMCKLYELQKDEKQLCCPVALYSLPWDFSVAFSQLKIIFTQTNLFLCFPCVIYQVQFNTEHK